VERTLAVCTCNAVHVELRVFDLAVMAKPPNWKSLVGRALRCFALRGRSSVEKTDELLGYLQPDMSCPRFLYRAFKSIAHAQDDASEVHDYWGAYYVIGVDLYLALRTSGLGIPDDIPRLGTRDAADGGGDPGVSKKQKSIGALCNIIDGLKQIVSATDRSYDDWDQARLFFGPDITTTIFQDFRDTILNQPNWHENAQSLDAARNLVLLWCNLERAYKVKLNRENDPGRMRRMKRVHDALEKDLDETIVIVESILDVMHQIEYNCYYDTKNTFEIHKYDLHEFKSEWRERESPGY
jgi:hypothetical protein